MRGTANRRVVAQAGYTLVEVLIALVGSLVVVAAAMTASVVSLHAEATDANRVDKLEQLETGLERMTHEIRQASAVSGGGDAIALTVRGVAVRYECSSGDCVRTVNGASTARPVSGLTQADVFALQCTESADGTCAPGSAPNYVEVHLVAQVPCQGQGDAPAAGAPCPRDPIDVEGGVELRNAR